jgi:hypothetical protein
MLRSSRPWLTSAACVAVAVLAFGLGRATAPNGARVKTPATASPSASDTARANRQAAAAARANPSPSTSASTDPRNPDAQREAEIIALLSYFKTHPRTDLGPELLGLVAWINAADEEDVELFAALGREILPDKNLSRGLILPLAFTRWTDLDAPAAFAAYLELPEDERSSEIAKIVFGGWMRQGEPREALEHALALQRTDEENSPLSTTFVGDLLEDFFRSDRALADEIARGFARSDDLFERRAAEAAADDMMRELADQEGPAAAFAWINDWPISESRADLRRELLDRLLNGDEAQRKAALELFAKMPNPEPGTVLSVARQKASTSMAEAQTWLMTLPPGEARGVALDGLLQTLENEDKLPEILPWLSSRTPHPDFDSAYSRLALDAFKQREDFPRARQWLQRVVDPKNATQLKSQLIARWLELDPENAVRVLGPQIENSLLAPPR